MPALTRRISPLFLILVAVAVLGAVLCVLATSIPVAVAGVFLLALAGWAVSLCLHEFGHAVVAYRMGDTSVAARGYLTLDIRRYTDFRFSLVLPLIILLIGGLPLPGGAVWINNWALRSRARRSAVSVAGPAANLVLGIVLTFVVAAVSMPPTLAAGLSLLAQLQVIAFVLNMLPIPGLDGWGALEPYLSPSAQQLGARARPWAPLVLLALLLFVPTVGSVFFGLMDLLYGAIGGDQESAARGFIYLMFWRYL